MPGSPSQTFADFDAVFMGEVTHLVDKRGVSVRWLDVLREWFGWAPSLTPDPNAHGYQVTLNVLTSWKGVTTTPSQLSTGYGGGDCGYSFVVGAQYIVYASGALDALDVYICSRTAELSQAAADLTYLNTLPPLTLTAAPSSSTPLVFILCGGVLGSSVVALGLVWLWQRRRKA